MRNVLLPIVTAISLLYTESAISQSQLHQTACNSSAIDPDVAISGCTAVLTNSSIDSRTRVAAYVNRAAAHLRKGDQKRAYEDCSDAFQLDPASFPPQSVCNQVLGPATRNFLTTLSAKQMTSQPVMLVDNLLEREPTRLRYPRQSYVPLSFTTRSNPAAVVPSPEPAAAPSPELTTTRKSAKRRSIRQTKSSGPKQASDVLADTFPEKASENQLGRIRARAQEIRELPTGTIILDAPKLMRMSEARSVEARVGVNVPIELLRQHATDDVQRVESLLRTSSEMVAVLYGPGFKITPTTPEQQTVAEGFPTVWNWNVEPLQSGDQELTATLYALVPDGDKLSRQRIESYTRVISVNVKEQTWPEWLKTVSEGIGAVSGIITAGASISGLALGWVLRGRQPSAAHKPEGKTGA